jgi:hypothetical protein
MRTKRSAFRVTALAGALLVMVLAACDTQPATNITHQGATLNGKGACNAGVRGTYEYQIRPAGSSTWTRVGPRHSFDCSANTGEQALIQERAEWLPPSSTYAYRLVSRLSNGTVQTWDSNGTEGGTVFDTFTTHSIIETEVDIPLESLPNSPLDPGDTTATAAGCSTKRLTNRREGKSSILKELLWVAELRSIWRRCSNGKIVRTSMRWDCWGEATAWHCRPGKEAVWNYSSGGNPEHHVHTADFFITGKDPIKDVEFSKRRWCATNQLSATTAYRKHGRCDAQPW